MVVCTDRTATQIEQVAYYRMYFREALRLDCVVSEREIIANPVSNRRVDGHAGRPPYLDYRPLKDEERAAAEDALDAPWLSADMEGRLRLIEVKGRAEGADTVTVTHNEIVASLNKQDAFILAIVEVANGIARAPRYTRKPFAREPDFGATSVTYNLAELLKRAEPPS